MNLDFCCIAMSIEKKKSLDRRHAASEKRDLCACGFVFLFNNILSYLSGNVHFPELLLSFPAVSINLISCYFKSTYPRQGADYQGGCPRYQKSIGFNKYSGKNHSITSSYRSFFTYNLMINLLCRIRCFYYDMICLYFFLPRRKILEIFPSFSPFLFLYIPLYFPSLPPSLPPSHPPSLSLFFVFTSPTISIHLSISLYSSVSTKLMILYCIVLY